MKPIRQCISWWCFARDDVTPERLVKTAADIGYAAIEMPPRESFDLIREHGLIIGTIPGHQSLVDGLNKRENHDRIEDELLANLELAKQYAIPNLICFSGNRNGKSEIEGAENTAEGIARVAKAAEKAGITLIIELLNSKVDHHDYQCDTSLWGVHVCKMVSSPRVRLLNDLYHMQIMEGDLIRNIRTYQEYYAHYHTAGNPGRRDMDDTQEIYYPAVARAIAETDYEGLVGHEFIPKGEPMAALRAAYDVWNVSV